MIASNFNYIAWSALSTRTSWQWQPTATAHDPNPPITLHGNDTVTPNVGALTITTFAPVITVAAGGSSIVCTPGVKSLSLATLAPGVATPRLCTPATKALATTGFAPTVGTPRLCTPGTRTLGTTGLAPVIKLTVSPSTRALSLTTFAPVVSAPRRCTPGVVSLTLTILAPAVNVGINVVPGAAALATAGFPPTVLAPRICTPATIGLVISGLSPAIRLVVIPPPLALSLTTFAPNAATPRLCVPGAATLSLTTFSPSITTARLVTPATQALIITGLAPSVQAPRLVVPATEALSITAFAPTAPTPRLAVPAPATLTITRFAPVALLPRLVTPGTCALTLTGLGPRIDLVVRPGLAILTLGAMAPQARVGWVVKPTTKILTITTLPADLLATQNQFARPGVLALNLNALQPRVLTPRLITVPSSALVLAMFAPAANLRGFAYLSPVIDRTADLSVVLTRQVPIVRQIYTVATAPGLVGINTHGAISTLLFKGDSLQLQNPTIADVLTAWPGLPFQMPMVVDEEGADFTTLSYGSGAALIAAVQAKIRWADVMRQAYPDSPRFWYNPIEIHPLTTDWAERLAQGQACVEAFSAFDRLLVNMYVNEPGAGGLPLDFDWPQVMEDTIELWEEIISLCNPRPQLAFAVSDMRFTGPTGIELIDDDDPIVQTTTKCFQHGDVWMFDENQYCANLNGYGSDTARVTQEQQRFYDLVDQARTSAGGVISTPVIHTLQEAQITVRLMREVSLSTVLT